MGGTVSRLKGALSSPGNTSSFGDGRRCKTEQGTSSGNEEAAPICTSPLGSSENFTSRPVDGRDGESGRALEAEEVSAHSLTYGGHGGSLSGPSSDTRPVLTAVSPGASVLKQQGSSQGKLGTAPGHDSRNGQLARRGRPSAGGSHGDADWRNVLESIEDILTKGTSVDREQEGSGKEKAGAQSSDQEPVQLHAAGRPETGIGQTEGVGLGVSGDARLGSPGKLGLELLDEPVAVRAQEEHLDDALPVHSRAASDVSDVMQSAGRDVVEGRGQDARAPDEAAATSGLEHDAGRPPALHHAFRFHEGVAERAGGAGNNTPVGGTGRCGNVEGSGGEIMEPSLEGSGSVWPSRVQALPGEGVPGACGATVGLAEVGAGQEGPRAEWEERADAELFSPAARCRPAQVRVGALSVPISPNVTQRKRKRAVIQEPVLVRDGRRGQSQGKGEDERGVEKRDDETRERVPEEGEGEEEEGPAGPSLNMGTGSSMVGMSIRMLPPGDADPESGPPRQGHILAFDSEQRLYKVLFENEGTEYLEWLDLEPCLLLDEDDQSMQEERRKRMRRPSPRVKQFRPKWKSLNTLVKSN